MYFINLNYQKIFQLHQSLIRLIVFKNICMPGMYDLLKLNLKICLKQLIHLNYFGIKRLVQLFMKSLIVMDVKR